MQPSFDQLPEKKQHEIRQVVEVIKEVIGPEMVILFGSYAKGTWVDHQYHSGGLLNEYMSDYDFLVVTQTSQQDTYVQEHRVIQKVDHFDPPVNLEIHGIEHINKGLEWGEYFWADIIKEGIILFDKKTVQFSQPRVLTPEERKEKAQKYFDTWFPQANEFLFLAGQSIERSNFKLSDFLLHQAAECLFYSTLTVFTNYKPKIHNLWKLRKKAKPYSDELLLVFKTETDKNDERLFELLKQGYIEARYKHEFSISKEDVKTLIERVTLMAEIVERICKERISDLDK